jgi:hypothetical protein
LGSVLTYFSIMKIGDQNDNQHHFLAGLKNIDNEKSCVSRFALNLSNTPKKGKEKSHKCNCLVGMEELKNTNSLVDCLTLK